MDFSGVQLTPFINPIYPRSTAATSLEANFILKFFKFFGCTVPLSCFIGLRPEIISPVSSSDLSGSIVKLFDLRHCKINSHICRDYNSQTITLRKNKITIFFNSNFDYKKINVCQTFSEQIFLLLRKFYVVV